jgi:REP element-mobilizing transposase RayT
VTIYRRRLPHVYETQNPVFLTWRLHGSLPANRPFHGGSITSGKAFVTLDRLLDEQSIGPLHLRHPAIADLVVEAIHHNGEALHHYQLHAYAIMPNHVHLLLTPAIPLPRLTRSLKGITAKRANEILALTGTPFWQEETYDREVRDQPELDRIRSYIETNPVHAGLVLDAAQYRWSSAGQDQSRQASRAA